MGRNNVEVGDVARWRRGRPLVGTGVCVVFLEIRQGPIGHLCGLVQWRVEGEDEVREVQTRLTGTWGGWG